jgi:diaminohydroxyphosphoribosylaminopyrimidine deaminase/5-amino-6-(5-phosphoribosylamino)uracil reductase
MQRCIQLAMLGEGYTMPNPMVGAILVYKNRIIGEGWHQKAGQPHAEVNAVASVQAKDIPLIAHSTLYVNLEPCNHYGKTPPCTDLILREGIRKVVIGSVDDNPLVGGKGIACLRAAGVEVVAGVLEKECRELNRRFFISHQFKRPYITLKWAQSREGFIAEGDGKPVSITGSVTQRLTHQLRSQHMGILVGWKTVANDLPRLDNRLWRGISPQVILIDLNGQLNNHPHLDAHPHWWRWVKKEFAYRENDFHLDTEELTRLNEYLFSRNIQSVLVEGGAATIQQFLHHGLWDEIYQYTGTKSICKGIPAPRPAGACEKIYLSGQDIIQIYRK